VGGLKLCNLRAKSLDFLALNFHSVLEGVELARTSCKVWDLVAGLGPEEAGPGQAAPDSLSMTVCNVNLSKSRASLLQRCKDWRL